MMGVDLLALYKTEVILMKYFGKNLEFIDGTNGDSNDLFEKWNDIGWVGGLVTNANASYLYCRFPILGNKCRLRKEILYFKRVKNGS